MRCPVCRRIVVPRPVETAAETRASLIRGKKHGAHERFRLSEGQRIKQVSDGLAEDKVARDIATASALQLVVLCLGLLVIWIRSVCQGHPRSRVHRSEERRVGEGERS